MSSAPSHPRWVIFAGLDIMFGLLLGQNDLPHEDGITVSDIKPSGIDNGSSDHLVDAL